MHLLFSSTLVNHRARHLLNRSAHHQSSALLDSRPVPTTPICMITVFLTVDSYQAVRGTEVLLTLPITSANSFVSVGTVTVTLTIENPALSCTNSATTTVTISGPTADFSSDFVAASAPPLTVTFTDSSVPQNEAIVSWQWDFGDGNTSTEQNPTHVYEDAGTYTVTLVVTDSNGCTAVRTYPALVTVLE